MREKNYLKKELEKTIEDTRPWLSKALVAIKKSTLTKGKIIFAAVFILGVLVSSGWIVYEKWQQFSDAANLRAGKLKSQIDIDIDAEYVDYGYPTMKKGIIYEDQKIIPSKKDDSGSNIIFNMDRVESNYEDSYTDFITTLSLAPNRAPAIEVNKVAWKDNEARSVINEYARENKWILPEDDIKEMVEGLRKNYESYLIIANSKRKEIKVYSYYFPGLLHGMTTVQNHAQNKKGFKSGFYLDYPYHKERVLWLNFRNLKAESPEEKKKAIDEKVGFIREARKHQFNAIIASVSTDGVKLKSVEENWRNNCMPLYSESNKDNELKEVFDIANQNGLDVIPQIQLLTHQDKFFKQCYPDIMIPGSSSYDPKKLSALNGGKGYEDLVFPVVKEVLDVSKKYAGKNKDALKRFHIGHDEALTNEPSSASGCERDPIYADCEKNLDHYLKCRRAIVVNATDFRFDVMKIKNDLLEKDYPKWQMWMYSNMLLDPSEEKLKCYNPMHGDAEYAKLRKNSPSDKEFSGLPRDIVMNNFDYFNQGDFKDIKMLKRDGYKVVGYSWAGPKKICGVSKTIKEIGGDGMAAGTFVNENLTTKEIIRESGRYFWNTINSQEDCE